MPNKTIPQLEAEVVRLTRELESANTARSQAEKDLSAERPTMQTDETGTPKRDSTISCLAQFMQITSPVARGKFFNRHEQEIYADLSGQSANPAQSNAQPRQYNAGPCNYHGGHDSAADAMACRATALTRKYPGLSYQEAIYLAEKEGK